LFFFSSRRRHTRSYGDWSSDVCSSDLAIWYLNNNFFSSGLFGPTLPAGWSVVEAADFNGEGHPDYLLFNSSTLQTAIWYLNNNVFSSGLFGPTLPANWSLIAPEDYNSSDNSVRNRVLP